MGSSGMETSFNSFNGGAFEAFRFAQSRKKENPICLEEVLAQFPGHDRIRQSHFIYCMACQRFLGCRLQMTGEPFETPLGLDILLLCLPYLLELDAEGIPVRKLEHEAIFHCSGRCSNGVCGARLFRQDSVLSERHAWRKPESRRVEPAWYINNFFIDRAVNVGRPSCSHLAQGVMETATVWCSKCEATVGWKFVKDLCSKKPNVHYVHRFGVCESSVLELAAENATVDTVDIVETDDQSLALDMEEENEENEENEDEDSEEDEEEDGSSEDLSLDGLQDEASQEVYLEVSNQDNETPSETPTCS